MDDTTQLEVADTSKDYFVLAAKQTVVEDSGTQV